jgi:iron(III) transport system ATP-binding protein
VAASTAISLSGVTKRFGETMVLDGLDLEVPTGQITAVLGASGSGKTTLLRLIAGFERIDAGTLRVAGRIVDDGRHVLAARHRGVGYVPQEGALFPHLTIRANIAFGLRRSAQQSVRELLALIGLSELEKRYPHELSGGQQQRVALARALAVAPALVLLDEPFAALDASLRGELRKDVARILAETGTTAVLVTHDQDEALALASQIALLADGVVTARAAPRALYHDPPNPAAAASIGQANLLAGEITGTQARCVLGVVTVANGHRPAVTGRARLMLRPEQLRVHLSQRESLAVATVIEVRYHGHDALAELRLDAAVDTCLLAHIPGALELAPGQTVWVEVIGAARAWAEPEADRR